MKVIFIRHGQTQENRARRHQPADTVLSAQGREQVLTAAARLAARVPATTPVTYIVSSPLNRALETASLLADYFDIIPSIDYNLRELERPRRLIGHYHFSVRSFLFYKFWLFGWSTEGESYAQLRSRIKSARQQLECLPPEAVVVVVSHTVFMNLFMAHLYREKALWPWQAIGAFYRLMMTRNASMIELTFAVHEKPEWQRTNDLHLSEKMAL